MTIDEARKEFGHFPELTEDENEMILIARSKGFAAFYPSFPSATAQAQNTFKAAQEWLQSQA